MSRLVGMGLTLETSASTLLRRLCCYAAVGYVGGIKAIKPASRVSPRRHALFEGASSL